jgi:hypothetical protein
VSPFLTEDRTYVATPAEFVDLIGSGTGPPLLMIGKLGHALSSHDSRGSGKWPKGTERNYPCSSAQ